LGIAVLIVDDCAMTLMLQRALVEKAGHQVDTASGGAEAIALLSRKDYDVLLCDLVMPEVDGMAVLAHVRDHGIKVTSVIVTGSNQVNDAVSAMNEGAFDFVTKPMNAGLLERILDRAMERQSLTSRAERARAMETVFRAASSGAAEPGLAHAALEIMSADAVLVQGVADGTDGARAVHAQDGEVPWAELSRIAGLADEHGDLLGPLPELHALAVPVMDDGETIVTVVVWRRGSRPYSRADRERLAQLAEKSGLVLKNVGLTRALEERLSSLDEARNRVVSAMRYEGLGRIASDFSRAVQDPFHYLETNLRAAQVQLEALRRVDSMVTSAADIEELRDWWDDSGGRANIADADRRAKYAMDGAQRVGMVLRELSRLTRSRDDVDFDLLSNLSTARHMCGVDSDAFVSTSAQSITVRGNAGECAQGLAALMGWAGMGRGAHLHISVEADGETATVSILAYHSMPHADDDAEITAAKAYLPDGTVQINPETGVLIRVTLPAVVEDDAVFAFGAE